MKKMKTRYLPALASLLIIAVAMTSFLPVFAQLPTRVFAQPTLTVKTIAEDDEARATGVMWMSDTAATSLDDFSNTNPHLLSQYKLLVTYDGQFIYPDGKAVVCQYVEKDKVLPLKGAQFTFEYLASKPVENDNFVCKVRWGKPGVGVLDVYYVGALYAQYIADYILVVSASYTVGHTVVMGTEIQDICLLGWQMTGGTPDRTLYAADGTTVIDEIYQDPLGGYASCEDAALYQQNVLGLQILWQ